MYCEIKGPDDKYYKFFLFCFGKLKIFDLMKCVHSLHPTLSE